MIEYSVYMTTNHLSKDEGAKAYAAAQIREKLGTDKFVAHVARHNSVFSKGTIKGVLADVACCVREQLLNGNKVQLEGLGTFGFTINSQGAENVKDFTSANIKKINVIFTRTANWRTLSTTLSLAQRRVVWCRLLRLRRRKMVKAAWIWKRLRKREFK